MPQFDQIQHFLFEHHPLRGQIVRLQASFAAILDKHPYPETIKQLLGQALCASALMSSTVKLDGSLTLQCQSQGPVTLLVAECNHDYQLRGVARWKDLPEDSHSISALFPAGQLVITLDPNNAGSRYQAVVAMEGDSLADYLGKYFNQSEQLRTKLYLTTQGNEAVGLLLQALPETDPEQPLDWSHFTCLADTLKDEELLTLANEELLHRLYSTEDIRLFEPSPLCFRCTCNRNRFSDSLRHLGQNELDDILKEQGQVTVTCEFCHQVYNFDTVDVAALFQEVHSSSSEHKH